MEKTYPPFSVLFTVYYKEKPEFFKLALESILNQTVAASEWVIVKDGPLTPELDGVIDEFLANNQINAKIVALEKNMGSGPALAVGIEACSNELIAKMDSDDIAAENRFELQLNEFMNDDKLDVCGGQIVEFEDDLNNPIAERIVPTEHEEIYEYYKCRSGINHMTVMYKKSAVLAAGNYDDSPLMEDYSLFVRLLQNGAKFKNVDAVLVYARTNRTMVARRGGWRNYTTYKAAKKRAYKTGFMSYWQYKKMNIIQFIISIMPSWLRKFVFFNVAHKKVRAKDSAKNA